MNIEKEDLYIFGVILSRYENPSYHEKKFINKYKKLIIKKPVETTNEQPLYDNLKEWFEDSLEEDKDYPNWKKIHTHIIRCSNNIVNFQFKGFELVLLPDGKYILGDTSGG